MIYPNSLFLLHDDVTYISGFTSIRNKCRWHCNNCSHEWDALYSNVVYAKRGCPACAKNQQFRPIDSLTKLFSSKNIICLDEIKGIRKKYLWRCLICAYEWKGSAFSIIHEGSQCSKCRINPRALTRDQFIKQAQVVHGTRYDYSEVVYKNNHTKINILCLIHGVFTQTPNSHVGSKQGCPDCVKRNFSKKCLLWLNEVQKTYPYKIQHVLDGGERKISGTPFSADGFCGETNTIFEFHGNSFHGNPRVFEATYPCHPYDKTLTAEQLYKRTIKRQEKLEMLGYNIVVMWEDEWDKLKNQTKKEK